MTRDRDSWHNRSVKPAKRAKRPPAPVDAAGLEKAALSYLDRFDSSAANLRRQLVGRVRRAARTQAVDEAEALRQIDEIIARYQSSGLIDDARYAENMARGLRARGSSRRGIEHKLRARGIDDGAISEALSGAERDSGDAEFEAAQVFARRRRLGPHRPAEERALKRQRDLGVLARAGFSPDVARRVLGPSRDDEDAF